MLGLRVSVGIEVEVLRDVPMRPKPTSPTCLPTSSGMLIEDVGSIDSSKFVVFADIICGGAVDDVKCLNACLLL
jgi:hypothetical protein